MKRPLFLCCLAAAVLTLLPGCNSPAANGLLNNTLGIPVRILQALGRTAGMTAQTDQPSESPEAVRLRGQQIEQRGPHAPVLTSSPSAANVVQR
ncbi:MAG: hypothetical protein JNM99_16250 [Verrucomicrobiaceae bacterium]|nr:hypothetical protein [Verrucomicrobiaceae bacterium]